MLKNNKYHYKSYDIFNTEFGDDRVFDVMNPYGYNFEANSKRSRNVDDSVLKSTEHNRNSMSNDLKR